MTVQAATKMWSRDGGSITTTKGTDRKATIQEGYQVVCDPTDGVSEVLDAVDLPRLGDRYGGVGVIFCKKKSPSRVSPVLFVVQVDWEGDIGPGGQDDHPVNQPAEIAWSNQDSEEAIDEDFLGNPIVTVNNEPITGVTAKISDQVLTVKKNFYDVNLYALSQYLKATNSDVFYGWPAGTGRMIRYTANQAFIESDTTTAYWQVNASFQFREPYRTTPNKAWYARVRHEGFYVRDASGKVGRAFDEKNKEPVTTPVLLKEDGTREPDQSLAHWLEFQIYGSLPFSALGLT